MRASEANTRRRRRRRDDNRPFPGFKISRFQNEAKCKTFLAIMSFICMRIKNNFHINSFAHNFALIIIIIIIIIITIIIIIIIMVY